MSWMHASVSCVPFPGSPVCQTGFETANFFGPSFIPIGVVTPSCLLARCLLELAQAVGLSYIESTCATPHMLQSPCAVAGDVQRRHNVMFKVVGFLAEIYDFIITTFLHPRLFTMGQTSAL